MIRAAAMAAGDVFSAPFRALLWTSLGLTLALFVALLLAVEAALTLLTVFPWPWLETAAQIAAGLGLAAAFVFLAGPVTAMFAGLFLDRVAALVEARHYAGDPPGAELPVRAAVVTGLRFAAVVLLVNLAALPFLFFAVGAVVMVIANAYLLGREYFQMASLRHLAPAEAGALRRRHARRIFAAGFIPALLALVPLANLFVPLFATAYFTHYFKSLHRAHAARVAPA